MIEQPSLPIPAATLGPRHLAIAAAADELDRLGVDAADDRRRRRAPAPHVAARDRAALPARVQAPLPRPDRRARRGGRGSRRASASVDGIPLRVNRALVETDLVAARDRGRDGRRRRARRAARQPPAPSRCAPRARRRCSRRAGRRAGSSRSSSSGGCSSASPLTGVSLALNLTRIAGPFAGYPHDEEAVDRLLRSRVRWLFQLAPGLGAAAHPRPPAARADRGRGLRRHAVGRAHGGAAPRHASSRAARSTSRSTRS